MEFSPQKISVDAYTILGLTLTIISAGFVFIKVFFPHYFITVDNFRLVISSMGVSSPILLWNFILEATAKSMWDGKSDNNLVIYAASYALAITCFILYLAILLGFYFNWPPKIGVGIVVVLEISYTIDAVKRITKIKAKRKQ